MSESAKRTSNWSHEVEKTKYGTRNSGSKVDKGYVGHKAAKMMKRSKSIENRRQSAIDEKTKLLKNIEECDSLKIFPLAYYKNRLTELENVSFFYNDKIVAKI